MTPHVINGLIYLASPYSDRDEAIRQRRFTQACQAAADLMRRGYLVFCPITHSHPIARYIPQEGLWEPALDHELWRLQDAPHLDVCGSMIVLCLPGWHRSGGVMGEIKAMRAAGKPVEFMRLVAGRMRAHPRARRITEAMT